MVHKKYPNVLPGAFYAHGANLGLNSNEANLARSGNLCQILSLGQAINAMGMSKTTLSFVGAS